MKRKYKDVVSFFRGTIICGFLCILFSWNFFSLVEKEDDELTLCIHSTCFHFIPIYFYRGGRGWCMTCTFFSSKNGKT